MKAIAFMRGEIERSAYEAQRRVETGEDTIVGVNKFEEPGEEKAEIFAIDTRERDRIVADLRDLRASRDQEEVRRTLDALKRVAGGTGNLLPPILDAVEAYATVGEICRTLEGVFGTYRA